MKFFYQWLVATLGSAATMFVWGRISHMVLLKGIGFTRMPNEERIVSTLPTSLHGDGLYFFPSIDLRGSPTGEEQAAWEARLRAGPTGMIIYHAAGDAPVSPKKLSVQFLSNILAAGVVSYLLSLAVATFCELLAEAVARYRWRLHAYGRSSGTVTGTAGGIWCYGLGESAAGSS